MLDEKFSHVCATGVGHGAVSLCVGCISGYYLSGRVSKLRRNVLRASVSVCGVDLWILF